VTRVRVVVVDDQPLFREGMALVLAADPTIEVVGEAGDGREALAVVARTAPDVVLMDLSMPVMGGVDAIAALRTSHPGSRVVAITTFADDELLFDALREGAAGYLLKDAGSAELRAAVQVAARGASYLQPTVTTRVIAELARRMREEPAPTATAASFALSERELEILRQLAAGASNRAIAAALFIAEGTVKNHVTSILAKLDVDDRTQAAIKARALRLV
jgi:DNA-binding NarL/FixJ family response regulator